MGIRRKEISIQVFPSF